MTGSLGSRFDRQANALNVLRLLLAFEVIAFHAYSLRHDTWLPGPVVNVARELGVDGFFAISGFLICRSWVQRPHLRTYLAARARRILPGFWVCLLVTAFVVAPVISLASDIRGPAVDEQLTYVGGNAGVWITQWGIGPVASWNGSLWSLAYEVACYLLVALFGVVGLLRARLVVVLAVGFWVLELMMAVAHTPPSAWWVYSAGRAGLMFFTGAVFWFYRDRIPVARSLAAVAGLVLVASPLLPLYRVAAAPALAYLLLAGGLWLARWPRMVVRNDLSYGVYVYGFVVQTSLLLLGVHIIWPVFLLLSVAGVLPLAALSWFLVERPAMRLGRRRQINGWIAEPSHQPSRVAV